MVVVDEEVGSTTLRYDSVTEGEFKLLAGRRGVDVLPTVTGRDSLSSENFLSHF